MGYQFLIQGQLRKLQVVEGRAFVELGKTPAQFKVGDRTALGCVSQIVDAGLFLDLPVGSKILDIISGDRPVLDPNALIQIPADTKIYPVLEERPGSQVYVVTEDLLVPAADETEARTLAASIGANRIRPSGTHGFWFIAIDSPAQVLPSASRLQQAGIKVEPQLRHQKSKKSPR